MEWLNLYTKALQEDKLSLLEAHMHLENVMENFPTMGHYVKSDATIFHSPIFESAVCKIQEGISSAMTSSEKNAAKKLRVSSITTSTNTKNIWSNKGKANLATEQMLARNKRIISHKVCYIDENFVFSNSNVVERVFSVVKCFAEYHHHSLSPLMLKALLFLKFNKDKWDITHLSKVMKILNTARCTDLDDYWMTHMVRL